MTTQLQATDRTSAIVELQDLFQVDMLTANRMACDCLVWFNDTPHAFINTTRCEDWLFANV